MSWACKEHDFGSRGMGEQLNHEGHWSHPDYATFKFKLDFGFRFCLQVFRKRLIGCRLIEIDVALSPDPNCFISKIKVLFNLFLFLTAWALIDLVSFCIFANRN